MAKCGTEEWLRQLIDASGLSSYRVAKQIGVTARAVRVFRKGGGLLLPTAEKLWSLFGFEVVKKAN